MKLRIEMILFIFALVLIIIPLSVYSGIMDNNNLTGNNTTLLNVPDVREPTDFSSGATSLQAVLVYYGTDVSVDQLINLTNSSENGTLPANIAQGAVQLGFSAEVKENMTLEDLQNDTNQGIPVIIDCQAWKSNNTNNTSQNWTTDQQDGHYMVVIGIDKDNVYFEDPAILGSRGYIPNQEFLDRWHDTYKDPKTGNNTTVNHLGIIISGKPALSHPLMIKID